MKSRPILFSAPMVRALLAGTKTQTRMAIKDQQIGERFSHMTEDGLAHLEWLGEPSCGAGVWDVPEYSAQVACPHGQPGDQLWVRETWSGTHAYQNETPSERVSVMTPDGPMLRDEIWYWADGEPSYGDWERPRPSIQMPRWASRITLEITGVRVERLQAISEADAIAEGCTKNHNGYYWGGPHPVSGLKQMATAVSAYRDLWNSINGLDSWALNPWVWVVEFKRIGGES